MFRQFVQSISTLFKTKKTRWPEEDYVITLTDESIEVAHPNGTKETVRWDDLQTVQIVTTDQGPLPDVWFVLCGKKNQCRFPQDAPKSKEAYERLARLEGFDYETFIQAMCVAENAQHLVWQRQE